MCVCGGGGGGDTALSDLKSPYKVGAHYLAISEKKSFAKNITEKQLLHAPFRIITD